MSVAPTPEHERARLAALHRYEVLGASSDNALHRLTGLAAAVLGTPMAVVSLLGDTCQWYASAVGMPTGSAPRNPSLCEDLLQGDDVIVVPDTDTVAHAARDPLVTGDTRARFIAAAALTTPAGHRIGALYACDRDPRPAGLSPPKQELLRALAAAIVDLLEARRGSGMARTRQASLDALLRAETGASADVQVVQDVPRAPDDPYVLLFQNNPQPMWLYDVETLGFLDVNAAAQAIYGYSRQDFLARTILDIRPPEEVDRVRDAARDARGEVIRSGPWRHVRSDGTIAFVRVSSYPTTYEGRPARLVLVTDISAEKHLEEQLVQAQKMEAIGQLAGGVAHDFNNLLTVINGYAQLLMSRLHQADPVRVDAGHILQAGERAAALTQQLLAFSRRQVLQPRALDVAGVIGNLRPMLGRLLREDIEVRTVLPATLPPVMVDPVQIEQVLINLAINGSDAMPAGGTLSIEAGDAQVDAETADLLDVRGGPYVTVSVTDSGVGMDEDTRIRIFEPFFTTKGRGSGLGLPVAYGIVKQSGGTITVRTAPGEGSTFTVYLPLASTPASEEQRAPPVDTGLLAGQETVLIVEDHEAVRRLAADVLRKHGYHVLEADHGPAAIEIVDARGGRVDLLLTDVIMPRMSGREVATAIQQRVPDLGVLFMSGYTETDIVQNGSLQTGLHFLSKPFTPAELLVGVRAVLAQARSQRAQIAEATASSGAETSTQARVDGQRRRIVVADDDPGLRLLLAATLVGAGYEVLQAGDGLEALRLCAAGRVDLLITDLVMPDHEGLETIRRMRQEHPSTPVVAMSGAFDGGFLEVARAMGAVAVIQKPFTPAQVVEMVGRVFENPTVTKI